MTAPYVQQAVIFGEAAELNGLSTGRTVQNHHLGREPDGVVFYLECTTAEHSYAIGDRLYQTKQEEITYAATDTYVYILCVDATPAIVARDSTPSASNATAARWKAVAIPYIYADPSVIGN